MSNLETRRNLAGRYRVSVGAEIVFEDGSERRLANLGVAILLGARRHLTPIEWAFVLAAFDEAQVPFPEVYDNGDP
jgi:hypothetical protein